MVTTFWAIAPAPRTVATAKARERNVRVMDRRVGFRIYRSHPYTKMGGSRLGRAEKKKGASWEDAFRCTFRGSSGLHEPQHLGVLVIADPEHIHPRGQFGSGYAQAVRPAQEGLSARAHHPSTKV